MADDEIVVNSLESIDISGSGQPSAKSSSGIEQSSR